MSTGGIDHAELAIAKAQMGQRQTDSHIRVGVMLWVVLGFASTLYAASRPDGFSMPWMVGLQIASLAVAVLVAWTLGRRNQHRWAAEEQMIRDAKAAEKARQLEEFMKAKKQ